MCFKAYLSSMCQSSQSDPYKFPISSPLFSYIVRSHRGVPYVVPMSSPLSSQMSQNYLKVSKCLISCYVTLSHWQVLTKDLRGWARVLCTNDYDPKSWFFCILKKIIPNPRLSFSAWHEIISNWHAKDHPLVILLNVALNMWQVLSHVGGVGPGIFALKTRLTIRVFLFKILKNPRPQLSSSMWLEIIGRCLPKI